MVILVVGLIQPIAAADSLTAPEQPTVETTQNISTEAQPTESVEPETAEQVAEEPAGPFVLVNGKIAEQAAPFEYNGCIYVTLRFVTEAIRPDAVVSWVYDHASITAEGLNITAYPNRTYIEANGRYLYLPYGVRSENGRMVVPLNVLAKALDAKVDFKSDDGNFHVTTGSGAIVPGDEYYDEDALYWMSHIIHAESGNQSLKGMIAVGNVVLNRVENPLFPNTIYGVIFQKNQFTPARTGTIQLTPNSNSIIAAKLCLDGAEVLPDALWFNRANLTSWASRNRPYIATIGSHAFYA